ncbi:FabD/lysophospholipase-like protein [Myriangium duriaei CBS 260.36]|uniref:FabD/lysophospholipase-like protein n=1 Tax=Myriangium duriaei CBS 260.36 TaxID=1168546 RepID=A0A9P4MML6_9PEZI|nr:FabD/lysophospholipase-like protein [Myriangium duriaei CBS 260.36]
MPERGLRLLTLDGGGVRGLSSLIILQSLMVSINRTNPPKPCDWFDMIGGTSTGGLIAIMLGRLKMNVDECIEAYLNVMDKVFKRKHVVVNGSLKIQGRYDTQALESAIKDLVKRRLGCSEALLDNREEHAKRSVHSCRVFVCAARKETSQLAVFTSYESDPGGYDLLRRTKVWEAARATSAAPTYFDPIAIGLYGELFVDGGLGNNNPVNCMWTEAQRAFALSSTIPSDLQMTQMRDRVTCLLSIGTGRARVTGVHDSCLKFVETLTAMLTDSHRIAMGFQQDRGRELNSTSTAKYFRFDVDSGLDDVGLEEKQRRALIAGATRDYLSGSASPQVEAFERTMQSIEAHYIGVVTELNDSSVQLQSHVLQQHQRTIAPAPGQARLTFESLTDESKYLKRNQTVYWRMLTEQSLQVYEQIIDSVAGRGNVSLSQIRPQIPQGRLRNEYLPLYWTFLGGTPHKSLERGLGLGLLYMLHVRHVLHYDAEIPNPEGRLQILRRMDRWVECACGCKRHWNFCQDIGLTRTYDTTTWKECSALKFNQNRGKLKDYLFNRRGGGYDTENRRAWLAG